MSNEMQITLGVAPTLPLSYYVEHIRHAVDEGTVNPLTLLVNLRKVEKIINTALKDEAVSEAILDAIDTYPGGKAVINGVELSRAEAGVKYDYSLCGDAVLDDLESQAKALKERIAERQKMLKAIPNGGQTVVNEETGEVMPLHAPAKCSSTIVKATIR